LDRSDVLTCMQVKEKNISVRRVNGYMKLKLPLTSTKAYKCGTQWRILSKFVGGAKPF
jgi:hypothetical protein